MRSDEHHVGEDEKSDGNLYPYAYWICHSCDTEVHDWQDEYEPPTDT